MKKIIYTLLALFIFSFNGFSQDDDPCDWSNSPAEELNVGSSCSYTNGSISNFNSDSGEGDPGCGSYSGYDVWYSFTVPASGSVLITTQEEGLTDMAMAVYTGSCGSLSLVGCNDDGGPGLMPEMDLSGGNPGETVWVRLWDYGGDDFGDFDICIVEETCSDGILNNGEQGVDCGGTCPDVCVPTVQDCEGAIPICQDTYSESTAYSGVGNFSPEIDSGTSCLGSGEKNDVWYVFTVINSGTLDFSIIPNDLSDDYDWAVYNLTNANCADIYTDPTLEVSCNFYVTDDGITGPNGDGTDNDEPTFAVTAGETYVVNVSQYSTSTNGYTIDFTDASANIYDDVPPVFESVDTPIPCGATTLTFHFNENVDCSTVEIGDFYLNGPGGPYTLSNLVSPVCDAGGDYDQDYSFTVSPALTTSGTFTLGMDATSSSSVADICGNTAASNSFDFDIINITTTPTQTDLTCNGDADGVAIVTLNITGTADYTYDWSNGTTNGPTSTTNNSITGLSGGNYSVTVTDALGCQAVENYTIVEPPALVLNLTPTDATCGQSNGAIDVAITNGVSPFDIDWSPGANANNQASGYDITGLSPQSYGVTVTDDDGCSVNGSSTVGDAGSITAVIDPVANQCLSGNSFAFNASNSTTLGGSPSYSWDFGDGNTGTGVSPTHTYASDGTYTVTLTITDGSCTDNTSINITVNPMPTVNITPTDATCNGYSDGHISIAVNTGTAPLQNIDWSPNGFTGDGTVTYSDLTAGNYSVTFEDANGCPGNASASVNEPAGMVLSASSTDALCNTSCDGTATANITSGGTAPFDYDWNAGDTPNNSATTGSLCAGSYTVTVTDANSCEIQSSVTVNAPSAVTISETAHTDVDCNGNTTGSLTVSASGGTSGYQYNIDGGTNQASGTFSGLAAGTYTLEVVDANNCTETMSITITEPNALTVAEVSHVNVTCNGGNNGSLISQASGGTTAYQYSIDGGTNWQANGSFSSLSAGTYTIDVKDANNCTTSTSITITEPTPLTATIPAVALTCNGACNGQATVTAGGGSGSYNYSWNNTANSSTATTAADLCGDGTTYTVTVADANDVSCTVTATITPTEPAALSASTSVTDASCNGVCDGTATVSASGGSGSYNYSWNNTANSSTATTAADLCGDGTTYTVTVADANDASCTITVTATPSQPTPPSISETAHTDVDCNGNSTGSLTVVGAGGTAGYQYNINGGTNQASGTFNSLTAGTYTLEVVDANSCTNNMSITITEPNALSVVEVSHVNVTCNGGNNGSLTAQASDGTGPYQYSIDGGTNWQATGSFNSLSAGTYTIDVQDANNCTTNMNITITEPTPLTASIPAVAANCNSICDAQATVNAGGGSGTYTYIWDNTTADNTATTTANLCGDGTTYNVTVADANDASCTITASITPTQPAAIVITTSSTNANCGASDGSVDVASVSGGSGTYSTYNWEDGSGTQVGTTANVTSLAAGTYYLTITDDNGCTGTSTATIDNNAAGTVTVDAVTDVTCNGGSDGAIDVTESGGAAPLTISWSGPGGYTSSNEDISGLIAGAYTINITDANGCVASASATVNEPTGITAVSSLVQDVSCNGGSDGSVTVTPNGGTVTSGYTYEWFTSAGVSTGQTSQSATALPAGDYYVVVSDNATPPCSFTSANITISEPTDLTASAVITSNYNGEDISCNGAFDGAIDLTASNATPTYSYSWTGPNGFTSALEDISGLEVGTYDVTVTDANGCTETTSITLTEPAVLAITTSVVDAHCGQADGEVDVPTVTGGTTTYTYNWEDQTPAQIGTAANVTGLLAGTYDITVTDANGCTAISSTTINDLAGPNDIAITVDNDVTVLGNCDGQATVSMTGAASYQWYDDNTYTNPIAGQTNATATGLCAQEYCVIVTDVNGCTDQTCVTIVEPGAISITGVETQNLCNGDCNGTIDITATGGVGAPYSFSWENDANPGTEIATSEDLASLCAGSYSVTVTDANGATGTYSASITEPTLLTASTNITSDYNGENISCNGAFDGAIDLTVANGTPTYTYSWTGPNGFISALEDISGLEAGTYNVTATDANGCPITSSISLTEPSALSLSTSAVDAHCGQTDGSVAVATITGGTGSYIYNWEDNTNTQVGTSGLISPLAAGTYDVTVTDDNGCTITSSQIINDIPGPTDIAIVVDNDVTVLGNCDGQATVSMTGATTYQWYDDNTYANPIAGQTSATASSLCAQEYCVIVTDNNGCTDQACVTIQEPGAISITSVLTQNLCNGDCNGQIDITPTGGIGAPYTYNWENNSNPGTSISTSEDLSGLCAGTYSVTVADANGALGYHTATITEPTLLTISTSISSNYNGEDISCNGASDGSIDLSVANGTPTYTYSWTGPNGFTSALEDISSLEVGSYFVTATDANGCQILNNIALTQPDAIVISTSVIDAHCGLADGTVDTLSIDGGTGAYSFNWDDNSSTQVGTTANVSNLVAGTYDLTVSDANGCTGISAATINDISAGTTTMVIDNNSSCYGECDGQATVSVSGGGGSNTYAWSTTETTQTATGLCANTYYYVTATDAWGCQLVDSIQTTEPPVLSNSFINISPIVCNSYCDGFAQANPSGGTTPYTYQWDNSGIYSTDTVGGLCAGWYHVTISDAHGCSMVDSIEFTEPLEILLSSTVVNAHCGQPDGSIDLTVTNGSSPYTYDWNNDGTGDYDDTEDISSVTSGNYSVTVQDFKGCMANTTIAVLDENGPTASITDSTMIDCHANCNGTATVTASGGVLPYTYSWSDPTGQSTPTATNLCAGTFDVTVTDASGCIIPLSVLITEPDALAISTTSTDPDCNGDASGSITTLVNGGVTPYVFAWDNTETTADISNLNAGVYNVTVTDDHNCTIQDQVTLTDPSQITLSISYTEPSCNGGSNGTATVSAFGGTVSTDYNYTWDDSNSQNTATASNLTAGIYTVTVTDNHGCSETISVTVTEPTVLQVSINSFADPSCYGYNDGFVTLDVTGATPNYSYNWNSGQNTQTINNLTSGNYIVTVSDAQGCSQVINQNLSQPDELVVSLNHQDETCYDYNDGWIHSTTVGGTVAVDYNYQWSNLQNTSDLDNIGGTTTYTLTVSDDNGCTDTASATIIRPPLLSVININSIQSHCNQADGSADLQITGGTGPGFIYEWQDNSATVISNTLQINAVTAGSYYFTVTDGLGCQATETVNISDLSAPVITGITFNDVTCHGLQNGDATVNINGGVSPYNYSWDSNPIQQTNNSTALSNTAYNLSGGTYSVEVTDDAGCMVSQNITIYEPDTLIANIGNNYSDVLCHGDNTGWAMVQQTGGTSPYTWAWNDAASQTTQTASNLVTGNYTAVVTDANGCVANASQFINEPSQLVMNYAVQEPLCNGDTNGVINLTVQGGTNPYDINWSGNVGNGTTAGSLGAGQYNVVVNDDHFCSVSELITLGQPDPISFDFSTINETCDADNGQIIISAFHGGTPTYDVTVSPGSYSVDNVTNALVVNLTSGAYNVAVTDAHNCPYNQNVDVWHVTPPNIELVSQWEPQCYGGTDGGAYVSTLEGSGPYSYTWDNAEVNDTAIALASGTHYVTVVDGDGCTDNMAINITQPDPVTIVANGPSSDVCINQPTTLSVNATGGTPGYTFTWINPDMGNGQNIIVYPQADSTYHVYAVDAHGCPSGNTETITITTFPLISLNMVDTLQICQNESTSATVFATGGNGGPYAYNWSNNTYEDNITVTPQNTILYTVTVTDACSTPASKDSVRVIVHNAPIVSSIFGTDGCEPNISDLSVNASTNDGDIIYTWNYDDGTYSSASEFNTAVHTYHYSGVYHPSVHLVSENGCSTDTSVNVQVFPNPEATIGSDKTIADILDAEFHFNNYSTIESNEQLFTNWTFGDSLGSQDEDPIHIYKTIGNYVVNLFVTSSHGCVDSTYLPIYVEDHFTIYFPDAFTPGAGRGNNYFYPKGVGAGVEDYKMTIYDRWGMIIYETTELPSGYNERYEVEGGWNGKINNMGEIVQNGVYTYIVHIKDTNGVPHEFSGVVTVIR